MTKHQLADTEYDELIKTFEQCDLDKDGVIDVQDLFRACKTMSGKKFSYEDLLSGVRNLHPGTKIDSVSKDDFIKVASELWFKSSRASLTITHLAGATENSKHSIDEEEKSEFTIHINETLAGDADLADRLPFAVDTDALFTGCQDGLVLSKLINAAVPDTIDERVLNKKPKNKYEKTENNNVVINSAKAIGCSVVNIGSEDLIEGRPHLVLGLVWQIIKRGLFAKISLVHHPELFRLLEEDETVTELLALAPEAILVRWVNYHMKEAGHPRRIANFSADIKDSEVYTVLLHQLCPGPCSMSPLAQHDLLARAEAVLQNADAICCRKYVTPRAIVYGNAKLNLAFVANLFNEHPGLAPLQPAERASLDDSLFASDGSREARAFALWMNSLNVDPFVHNLFTDLRDGNILLQVIGKIAPGKTTLMKPASGKPSRFKAIETTNAAVRAAKEMGLSLVGIQGADLTDGHVTLTLALVWQLMRYHVTQTLASIRGDAQPLKDTDMVEWANAKVSMTFNESDPKTISSFNDSALANGRFLLALLATLKPGTIDTSLVYLQDSEENNKQNAKYAISVARKLGATIFVLPEDIVEVKPKMILTFIGSLMALEKSQ